MNNRDFARAVPVDDEARAGQKARQRSIGRDVAFDAHRPDAAHRIVCVKDVHARFGGIGIERRAQIAGRYVEVRGHSTRCA